MAQNITHNGPSQTEQTFFQRMLTRADHPNGAGWSNATNTNMRQPNAHQRARLTDTAAARGDSGEGYDDDIAEAVRRSVSMESFQSNNSQNYCNLPYSNYPSNNAPINNLPSNHHNVARADSISPMPSTYTQCQPSRTTLIIRLRIMLPG